MTRATSQQIDIEKELDAIWEEHDGGYFPQVCELIESMLSRVEEATIQRCEAHYEILKTHPEVPRLYASKAGEGK